MRDGGETYSDNTCILKKEPRGFENKLSDDFKFLARAAGKMRCHLLRWENCGRTTWGHD